MGVKNIYSEIMMAILFLSTLISVVMLYIAIFIRRAPKSLYFSYMILSVVFFNLGYIFELSGGGYDLSLLAAKIEYVGIPFITPFLFLFILEYCAKITVKIKHVILLMILPVISAILVITWPWSTLFYKSLEYKTDTLLPRFIVTGGVVYYIYFIYTLIFVFLSIIIAINSRKKSTDMFKKQTTSLVIASMLPAISYIINILKLGNLEIDTTPIFLSITCMLLGNSILRQGLYMLAPIALEQIVKNMNDGVILLDLQGMFINANSSAKNLFPELSTISSGSPMPKLEKISLNDDNCDMKQEFGVTSDEGVKKYYQVVQNDINNNGKVIGRYIIIYDITEVKERLDAVRQIAEHDALTGLINRGTLYKNGKKIFSQFGLRSDAAILMMDIDFFKNINDTYGHLNGDEVLKGVANAIASNLRSTDLVGRYGGEEFCIFLSRIDEKDIKELAEKLRIAIENIDFILNGEKVKITISIGIAIYDNSRHTSFESFLSDADAALYEAKKHGRNCVKFFTLH